MYKQFKYLVASIAILIGTVAHSQTLADYRAAAARQDYAAAVAGYQKLSDAGDTEAMRYLAGSYVTGMGVTKDLQKAAQWFTESAMGGNVIAQNHLGDAYSKGTGSLVAKDPQKAITWYQMAAAQGNMFSQNALGNIYEYGQGVPIDLAQAAQWYEKCLNQGYSTCQYSLALLLKEGRGVPKNEQRALELMKKSAAQGAPKAKEALASWNSVERPIASPPPQAGNAAEGQSRSLEQRLTELKSLLDKGLITSSEFEKKRADLLKSL